MAASTVGLVWPSGDRVDGPGGVKGKRQPIREEGGESTAAMAIILGQGRGRERERRPGIQPINFTWIKLIRELHRE